MDDRCYPGLCFKQVGFLGGAWAFVHLENRCTGSFLAAYLLRGTDLVFMAFKERLVLVYSVTAGSCLSRHHLKCWDCSVGKPSLD